MGEVYKATDTRLRRAVAIKVIRDGQIDNADRVRRFESEARAAAALDHPNILTVHDVGVHDGVPYIVSELLEGETMAALLEGGALPVRKAIDLALQVAHGLAAAHDKGIVHRDLKPSNLWLTRDGRVKILDFGLAKLTEPEPSEGGGVTRTTSTSPGTIVGTIGYMSPEQIRGEPLDARSDIFAFGAVLYEMLSGRRAFEGATAADLMSAILRQDPARLDSSGSAIPPSLDRIVRRCLEKKPEERFRSVHDLTFALEAVSPDTGAPLAVAEPPGRSRSRLRLVVAAVLGLAILGFGIALGRRTGGAEGLWGVLGSSRPAAEPAPPVRLRVELGADASLASGFGPAAILSPDGKLLAFTVQKAAGQRPQLYVRRLEQLQAAPLSGTEGARDPFFSPDSQWLGFFAEGKLKKVAVTGGAAVTLCDAPEDRGGTWSEDGTILFTPQPATGVGLSRVPSAGGTPEVLTTPDQAAGENSHRWPQALPGGKAVLFTGGVAGDFEGASIVVQSLPKGPRKVLQRGGYHGRYLRSGHIVYIHEGTLFAAPFDLGRLELTGPPAPVLEGVTANTQNAGAQFAFSDRGTLVFLPGQSVGAAVPIQWMDKDGKTEPLRALAGNYNNIRFSPDGQRLALDLREGRELDVWVYEWGRDTMSRLTFDPGEDAGPVWTPDGQRIAFASTRADKATANIYWQRADGTGEAERLTESKNPQVPWSWHPSGKFLAFLETGPQTGLDILILPMEGDETSGWKPGKPTVFLNSPSTEVMAAFSPDGKWLAYRSDESGRQEVYVRPFPGPGGKWQVSTGGGTYPTWSRNRKELFYRTLEFTIMVAPYAVEGDSFRADKPRQWSPGLVPFRGNSNRAFDLHPDGQRFAVLTAPELQTEEKRDKVVFIQNFFDELRRIAPATKR